MARHRRPSPEPDDLPPAKISLKAFREAARLFGYLWPYRYRFLGAMFALALSSLLGLAFPFLIGQLVNAAIHINAPGGSLLAGWGVDGLALAMMVVLGLQAAFFFFQSVWFTEVGERSLADLRRDAYARLIRLPMAFHVKRRVGELSSRIAADLAQIEDALIGAAPQFLRQSTLLIGSVILIAVTSGQLTLVMLSAFPALIGVAVLFGRLIRRNSRDAQDRLADSNVVVEETLQGVASVKAFGNEGYEQERYQRSLQSFLKMVLRGAKYRGGFVAFITFALFGAVVLVMWYGSRLVLAGALDAGQLASFMLYTMFAAGAMGSFAELYGQLQRTLGATHRVRELLEETPEAVDAILPPSPLGGEGSGVRGNHIPPSPLGGEGRRTPASAATWSSPRSPFAIRLVRKWRCCATCA